MLFIIVILILAGVAWYVMNADERERVIERLVSHARRVASGAARLRDGIEPLQETLEQRTPRALVTPVLAAASVAVFAAMVVSSGASGDPSGLLSWGASYGPRTTNGEWWRLLTSPLVHGGILSLAVNLAALISVGVVLERLVGHLMFAFVCALGAVIAGVTGLWASPASVIAGGSRAVFALYGLLLASWAWGTIQHATTTIRLQTVKRLAPAAAVFVLYNLVEGGNPAAGESAALSVGFVCGLLLAQRLAETKPPARRVLAVSAAVAGIAVIICMPMRGLADIRPHLEELLVLEERLARTYDAAVEGFRRGHVTARALADTIERNVLPDLQALRARVRALGKVPPEHEPMLAAAQTYLELREEGWRVRAVALRHSNMPMLREADRLEKASLDALQTIRR